MHPQSHQLPTVYACHSKFQILHCTVHTENCTRIFCASDSLSPSDPIRSNQYNQLINNHLPSRRAAPPPPPTRTPVASGLPAPNASVSCAHVARTLQCIQSRALRRSSTYECCIRNRNRIPGGARASRRSIRVDSSQLQVHSPLHSTHSTA